MTQWEDRDARRTDAQASYLDVMTTPGPGPQYVYYDAGVVGFVFGEMWSRPGLTRKERRWVTLSCVGAADATVPIESHVYAAMKSGDCTLEEMDEFTLHFATQMGWPKGQAVNMAVITQGARVAQEAGEPARSPDVLLWAEPTTPDARRARGTAAYEDVMRAAAPDARTAFRGLGYLDYLFGEIWTRPRLTRKERRIVSICCAAAIGADRETEAHLIAARDSGDLTYEEVQEVVLHFAVYLGWLLGSKLDDLVVSVWEDAD